MPSHLSIGWNRLLLRYSHAIYPILVSFILLLPALNVHPQSKYLVDNYWIENYGKKQGLPENIVIDITQDKKGYIWLTTPYKLVRFDGYHFQIFDPRKQFPDLYIHFYPGLVVDDEDRVWAGTAETGLFCFNSITGKFRRFVGGTGPGDITNSRVNTITRDHDNNIWVGTTNGLNLIRSERDSVYIRQFGISKHEKLFKALDEIISKKHAFAGFTKIGDLQKKDTLIEIRETKKVFVVCMGENGGNPWSDEGWIEDESGKKIWGMDEARSMDAGGASKNQLQFDVLTLQPGKYKVKYSSDDSHSWNKWNAAPPDRPDLWGIQLFDIDQVLSDHLTMLLKQDALDRFTYGMNFRSLLNDRQNNLWAVTNAGLEKIRFTDSSHQRITSEKIHLPANFFPYLFIAESDSVHLLLPGTVYQSEIKKFRSSILTYNRITNDVKIQDAGINDVRFEVNNSKNFLIDRHQQLWLGSFDEDGHGLYVSDNNLDSGKFKRLDISSKKPGEAEYSNFEQIWVVYQDRSGFIWVGSRQNGLFKINPNKAPFSYNHFPVSSGDSNKVNLVNLQEDDLGNAWLNTGKNGLYKYNYARKTLEHFPLSGRYPDNSILLKGERGNMTISAPGKLLDVDGANGKTHPLSLSVPDSLQVFGKDSFGNYWAFRGANHNTKSFYISNGTHFQPISFDSVLFAYGFYRNLYFGTNGEVWFAPGFEGVYQFKFNNETKKLTFVAKYLPEGVDVYSIYQDKNGIVWLGTYDDGLIRLDPINKKYKSFDKNDGLPSNFVVKVVGGNDRIWLITDIGSAFFDTRNEKIIINKELDDFIGQHTDGSLVGSYIDPGMYHKTMTAQSGDIIMASNSGFSFFDPSKITPDSTRPIVQVKSVNIDGQSLTWDESKDPELGHSQNNIEIEYIGLQYDEPLSNRYQYFLKGANKDWVMAGTERVARFSNLPAGQYEFFLRAANADGFWSDPQKMLAFTILPPWWKTWWAYFLYASFIGAIVWSYIAYRSRQLKKENVLLESKVEHRTAQLNRSLENLKSTQAQLVQSEKMASLGELTAGIAHEIQNPLNFVNNFSEINKDLLQEMKTEIDKGNFSDVKIIADDVIENENKINHHGRRADAIVKGMLQHSQTSSGMKELVDINALADEYFRLAYHGLRAKDKSFNATMKTDFDSTIGRVNLVPQEIGRVILNMINNAFYAVGEKKKQNLSDYMPLVLVSTKKINDKVEITIHDNGDGIPQRVVDKIFQPFFTTKPTGLGTGLGLSLSYDIIKAHNGEIKVETREGEGTTFIIQIAA